MWLRSCKRMFHSNLIDLGQVEKSTLAKLRKKTGYPFVNCRKALELHENDLDKALTWLNEQAQKEGWAKAEKLQGRKISQGLIGIFLQHRIGTMIEMNCETDFVARNREFQKLVSTVATACHGYLQQSMTSPETFVKVHLDHQQLMALAWEEQSDKTLSDLVALKIGQLGENMGIRRAVGIRVADHLDVQCYVHPFSETSSKADGLFLGKYGALVAFEKSTVEVDNARDLSAVQCGWQLAQHIIGMNPRTVGEISGEPTENKEDETQMVHQEFLADPFVTVGDFLQQNGIHILDFARYECGESLEPAE